MKAPFIPHETPWGDFSTYELPIDIKIHKLYLKTPANLNKLKKIRQTLHGDLKSQFICHEIPFP